jgi:hypothetical protein
MGLLQPTLTYEETRAYPRPPSALLEQLREAVHLQEDEPRMRRVAAGRMRLLVPESPATDKPFFGRVSDDGFSLTPTPRQDVLTSYLPVLEGRVAPSSEGCRLTVRVRARDEVAGEVWGFSAISLAMTVIGLAVTVGFALKSGRVTAVLESDAGPFFVGLVVLGLVLWGLSRLIASALFAGERRRAMERLEQALR